MVYNTRSVTKKKNSTEAEKNNQTWSNLPSDVTLLINQNLSLKDNIRASAVCKTWLQAFVSVRVEDPTPWVMFIPLYKDEYKLYDPSLGKTHIVKFPALRDSHVLHSKDGWLLMHDRKLSKPFFLNPFTQDRIEVDWRDLWLSDAIAFSCAPTSSSCVIFAVDNIDRTHFFIHIHRHTINKRNLSFLPHRLPLGHGSFEYVVFSNGVFYCLTQTGCLGMFDLSTSSWNVLPERSPNRLIASQCFMTEYRGDIYLVYTHGLKKKQTFLKLALTNRGWTEKKRLGLTFYLGVQSAVTSTTNRDLVETRRLNFCTECNVWIKPPMNVSDLFKS